MQSTTARMNIVNPLSHRLKAWHESLPPTLSLNSIDEGILNANGFPPTSESDDRMSSSGLLHHQNLLAQGGHALNQGI